MKTLVIFNKDWADEFDVHALAIMDEKQVQALRSSIPILTYQFGSNEGWEDHGDFRITDFHFRLLGGKEFDVLKTVIPFSNYDGYMSYGNFPNFMNSAHELLMYIYEDNGGLLDPTDICTVSIALDVLGEIVVDDIHTNFKNYVERQKS